jgi:hypothetical protein
MPKCGPRLIRENKPAGENYKEPQSYVDGCHSTIASLINVNHGDSWSMAKASNSLGVALPAVGFTLFNFLDHAQTNLLSNFCVFARQIVQKPCDFRRRDRDPISPKRLWARVVGRYRQASLSDIPCVCALVTALDRSFEKLTLLQHAKNLRN